MMQFISVEVVLTFVVGVGLLVLLIGLALLRTLLKVSEIEALTKYYQVKILPALAQILVLYYLVMEILKHYDLTTVTAFQKNVEGFLYEIYGVSTDGKPSATPPDRVTLEWTNLLMETLRGFFQELYGTQAGENTQASTGQNGRGGNPTP